MIEQLKADVATWILDWVSVHNDALGVTPCPFAKQALINNKIDFTIAGNLEVLVSLLEMIAKTGLKSEVLIIGMRKEAIHHRELSSVVELANVKHLMPAGYVALEDHPDDEEFVNGVKMNQGTWALILIQATEKLNQASLVLQKQGYYDNWTQEEYNDVVSWRFKKEKE
jgi:hypothetical protein